MLSEKGGLKGPGTRRLTLQKRIMPGTPGIRGRAPHPEVYGSQEPYLTRSDATLAARTGVLSGEKRGLQRCHSEFRGYANCMIRQNKLPAVVLLVALTDHYGSRPVRT